MCMKDYAVSCKGYEIIKGIVPTVTALRPSYICIFIKIYFYLLCMSVLPACMSRIPPWCLRRPKEDIGSPGTRIMDD